MKNPRVHIVILNWNGWRDTVECLESLLRMEYDNFQIVICDNDSSDESVDKLLDWANGNLAIGEYNPETMKRFSQPQVAKPVAVKKLTKEQALSTSAERNLEPIVLIQNGSNLGFAGGNNPGLSYALNADTDYCWLLNNDTVVETDTLSEMVQHSEQLLFEGVKNTCGSVQCFYDDSNVIQALGGMSFDSKSAITSPTLGRYLQRDNYDQIDHTAFEDKLAAIHGCSWLLPRSYLEDVGLMDDRYFLYYEEIDWALRSKGRFKLTYAPQAFVYHKEGASIGSTSFNRPRSAFAEYHLIKSRMLFCRKHLSSRVLPVAAVALLQAINRLRQRRWANAKSIIEAIFRQ